MIQTSKKAVPSENVMQEVSCKVSAGISKANSVSLLWANLRNQEAGVEGSPKELEVDQGERQPVEGMSSQTSTRKARVIKHAGLFLPYETLIPVFHPESWR